ncbi:MAG: hypothetical protein M0T84_05160 [Betaproteobacteria bacterium]|nr:hypothetical protein [Betaproteobacteria bacterium]
MRLYAATMTGDINAGPLSLNGIGRAMSQIDLIEKAVKQAASKAPHHSRHGPLEEEGVFGGPHARQARRRTEAGAKPKRLRSQQQDAKSNRECERELQHQGK